MPLTERYNYESCIIILCSWKKRLIWIAKNIYNDHIILAIMHLHSLCESYDGWNVHWHCACKPAEVLPHLWGQCRQRRAHWNTRMNLETLLTAAALLRLYAVLRELHRGRCLWCALQAALCVWHSCTWLLQEKLLDHEGLALSSASSLLWRQDPACVAVVREVALPDSLQEVGTAL